jgi:hypothetical protein
MLGMLQWREIRLHQNPEQAMGYYAVYAGSPRYPALVAANVAQGQIVMQIPPSQNIGIYSRDGLNYL